jgi:hypothetical protein
MISVIHDEDPEDDIETIEANLNFEEWISINEELLIELFIIYSIVIKYNIGIKTIKYAISNFYSIEPGVVSKDLIKARIAYLIEQILLKKPDIDMDAEINIRIATISISNDKLMKFISGKDYLMPLLKNRIKSKNRFNPDNISLKIRLAKKCDVSELNDIQDYIIV